MAYGLYAHFSFLEAITGGLGYVPARFRVQFWRDAWSSDAVEILAGGDPVLLKYPTSDDPFQPIAASEVTIELAAQPYWAVNGFYITAPNQIKIVIEMDPTGVGNAYAPFWTGWVRATNLTEAYQEKPYPVKIEGWDGLTTLKNKPLVDASGKRLTGQVALSTLLRTGVALTGLALPMVTGVNLFESGDVAVGQTSAGLATVSKDPLYQTLVGAQALSNEQNETLAADTALEAALTPFGARLAQVGGRWMIIRGEEAPGGWDVWSGAEAVSVRTRTYASANLSAAAGTTQALNLNVAVSITGQVRAHEGSTYLRGIDPGVRVEQSFGRFLSKLPNSDFAQIDASGLPTDWGANNLQINQRYRAGTGSEADPYRLVITGAGDEKINQDTPYVAVQVDYPVTSREWTHFQKRTLKGRFRLHTLRAAKISALAIRDDGPYFLKSAGEWVPLVKVKPDEMVGVRIYHFLKPATGDMMAKPGWADLSVELGTLDRVGRLVIFFCMGEALDKTVHIGENGQITITVPNEGPPTPFVEYADIRMEVEEGEGLALTGLQQSVLRPGQTLEHAQLSLTLGDVPDAAYPYDHTGSLFYRHVSGERVATSRWFRPDQPFTGAGPSAVGNTLLGYRTACLAAQHLQPANTFEGTLLGRLPNLIHSVLRFSDLGTPNEQGVIQPDAYLLTGLEYSLCMATNRVSAVQYQPVPPAGLPTPKLEWQTPEGLLPVNADELDRPLSPAEQRALSSLQKLIDQLGGLGIRHTLPGAVPESGYAPVEGGIPGYGAEVYRGELLIGRVRSILQKLPFIGQFFG